MRFTSLPPETILNIASYLSSSDLPPFARVNSLTYGTLHALTLPILKRQHSRSAAIHRFGTPRYTVGRSNISPTEFLDRTPALAGAYDAPEDGAIADLEYLRLNGGLEWLKPLPEGINESHVWERGTAVTPEHMGALRRQAEEELGVELPAAFVKFMSDQGMIESMYLGGDYFDLGEALVKVRSEDDGDGGGYVIRFLNDQQSCCFWALYVAPGGVSCVLNLWDDLLCWVCDERDELERRAREHEEQGGELADWVRKQIQNAAVMDHPKPGQYKGVLFTCGKLDCTLTHTDFEEWLCMKYFDGWISATLGDVEAELDQRQQEYLENFWPRKKERDGDDGDEEEGGDVEAEEEAEEEKDDGVD